jgi:hypothetical protein
MSTNPISGIGTLNPAVTYSNIQFAYIGEGNIDIDPQFVDSSNDNFYLKSNSKCIDTGTSNGAPDLDIENKIRPRDSGFDMGAYETYLVVDVVPYSPNPTNTNNLLNFSWNDVPGVNTYTFMCFNKLNPDNYIEVNNIAQNTYTIISALSDGSWCWKVMAFDENQISGKWSPIDTFLIDTIAPTVEIAGQPISPTKINSISLTIGGNGVTSYKYSFNNGPYGDETLITTPIDLLNLDDGAYMLSVVGKDAAGNLQSESLSTNISWIIDTVSPIITGLENDYSPSKQKVWTWDAIDDNVTSFRYMIDKSEFWNDPSGVYADVREAILSDEDGTWYLHVQAKDAAGHESDIHTVMVRMDNTPPIATVLGLPPTQTNSTSVTLQVSGDDVTHYRFGIDGGEYSGETSVEESITIHNLSDGHHVVSVLGRDSAGNWQATASVAEWMVDTVAPAAIVLDVPAEITGLTELSLVIDNTDVTHYKYSINGADYSDEFPSDTPLLVSNLADGKYTMSFLGRDRSGNWQDEDKATIVSWTVDTTPPSKVGDAYAVSGNGVVSLYWKNPSDSDFGRIIICSSLIAFPFSPEGCNVLYEGTREEFVDSQVTNKLTYYYSIFTTDGLNTSGATEITATPNARPIAQDQIVGIAGDVTTGILLSATDDDGDQLAYTTIVTNPSDGLISGTPPNVSYVANRDYYGVDRFTFVASDDSEESNAGTVTINIHSADSDADGVVNQWDACPGTRTDTYVDRHGCPDEIVWDINGDGKIGLEEAIRALQVVSGIE